MLADAHISSLGYLWNYRFSFRKLQIFISFRSISFRKLQSASQHGYSNLVKQPSWRGVMFCVYVQVHRSKTVAVFA